MFETWHQTTSIARYNLEILLDCYCLKCLSGARGFKLNGSIFKKTSIVPQSLPISNAKPSFNDSFGHFSGFGGWWNSAWLRGLKMSPPSVFLWRVSETRLLFDTCAGKTSLGAKNLIINWQSTASAWNKPIVAGCSLPLIYNFWFLNACSPWLQHGTPKKWFWKMDSSWIWPCMCIHM